jgi:hypothetical protein
MGYYTLGTKELATRKILNRGLPTMRYLFMTLQL